MDVSPINFKAMAYVLDVEGFDSGAALARCGFGAVDALDDRGPWLPAPRFGELMAAVVEVTRDPCFGLVAGKSKGLMRHVTLMQVTLVAPTLRQVIDDICRFAPLYLARSEVELCLRDGVAEIVVSPVVAQGPGGRFRTELVATSAAQMVRFARGAADDIHAVELPHDCPAGQEARYAATFGPQVRFGRERCAIVFNPRLLDVPLQTHDPGAYAAAREVAEAALAARGPAPDTAGRVRQWLLSVLPRQPSMAEAAVRLRLSERGLRRRLSASGVTYIELTQQCHRAMAEQLLARRDLSIKQVADRLGFASVAGFHRAFRRWTGTTPVRWRDTPLSGARRGPSGEAP